MENAEIFNHTIHLQPQYVRQIGLHFKQKHTTRRAI